MSAICDARRKKSGRQIIIRSSISWGSDELEIRCGRENQHPAEWAPRPPVEQPRRTGKKRGYGHKSWSQYFAALFDLQLPLTHNNTLRNPFEPFQMKWEVYFSKELCPLVFIVSSLWSCVHLYMSMQQ